MSRLSVSVLLLATAVACAPSAPAQTGGGAAPAEPAKPVEQSFVWATNQLSPTFDPHANLLGGARRWDVYEALTVQDPTGKTTAGQLAKEWRLLDPTNWEFTLVEGRKFHDGSPLTAEDVAFSATRALDPVKKFTITTRIPSIDKVTANGQYKVTVTTKKPDPILPKRLASLAILPKAALEKAGDEAFFKNPVGSGPFRFFEFVPDDHATVVAWKEHPTRKPKLEKVIVRSVPESAQRLNGLRTGVVDYAQSVPTDEYQRLKSDGMQLDVRTAGYSGSWGLDAIKDSPLKEKKVRWAINYAIDKEAVSKSVYAGLAPLEKGQVTQPEAFGFDPTLKEYPFDPKRAKELLAEAGYPNGFKVVADVWMASSEIQRLAVFIQQQLKDIGIEMEINGYTDVATFLDKGRGILTRAPMYNGAPAIIPQMDAEQALNAYLSTAQPEVTRRMNSQEFDRLVSAASAEMDQAKREKLLQDAAKILRDEAPVLFLVQQTGINGWSPKVKGLIPRIPDDILLETIEKIA